jgi:hypothetical protein
MTDPTDDTVSAELFKPCYCGHGKGAHAYPGERQPGACEVPMCVCVQYQPIPEAQ